VPGEEVGSATIQDFFTTKGRPFNGPQAKFLEFLEKPTPIPTRNLETPSLFKFVTPDTRWNDNLP
jgi:hypothetical protein